MAGPFKCIAFFELTAQYTPQISYGWSETYYSPLGQAPLAENAFKRLLAVRKTLMAFPAAITAYRITDTTQIRASYLVNFGALGIVNSTQYISAADNAPSCPMMRLYGGDPNYFNRGLFLRGQPDGAYNDATQVGADTLAWQQAYSNFGAYLQGSASPNDVWQMKDRTRPVFPPDGGANVEPILTWTANPTNGYLSQVTVGTILPEGTMYALTYRVKGLPTSPGLVQIVSGAGTLTMQVKYLTPGGYLYPGGGFITPYQASFNNIAQFSAYPRWTRRATGRPSDQPRGRRRAIPR
jgi:hypothetical protein